MTEAKYTPGPWWIDDFGHGDVRVVVDPVKGMPPPFVDGRTFVCKMYQKDERGIDAEANARLIAAAPELLEALIEAEKKLVELEHMVGGGDDEVYVEGAILNARAAIAKATGN